MQGCQLLNIRSFNHYMASAPAGRRVRYGGTKHGSGGQPGTNASLMTKVGSIIARERANLGMTIGELARKAGISEGLLSQLERGMGNPSIQMLSMLART